MNFSIATTSSSLRMEKPGKLQLELLQRPLVIWQNILTHWKSMGLPDYLAVVFGLLLILLARIGNNLFTGFVASKPEGRKTVIGILEGKDVEKRSRLRCWLSWLFGEFEILYTFGDDSVITLITFFFFTLVTIGFFLFVLSG